MQDATIADVRQELDRIGRVRRRQELTLDGLAQALTTLSSRLGALEARNRELAGELERGACDARIAARERVGAKT